MSTDYGKLIEQLEGLVHTPEEAAIVKDAANIIGRQIPRIADVQYACPSCGFVIEKDQKVCLECTQLIAWPNKPGRKPGSTNKKPKEEVAAAEVVEPETPQKVKPVKTSTQCLVSHKCVYGSKNENQHTCNYLIKEGKSRMSVSGGEIVDGKCGLFKER